MPKSYIDGAKLAKVTTSLIRQMEPQGAALFAKLIRQGVKNSSFSRVVNEALKGNADYLTQAMADKLDAAASDVMIDLDKFDSYLQKVREKSFTLTRDTTGIETDTMKRAEEWASKHSAELIKANIETVNAIRATVTRSFAKGIAPYELAHQLERVVGLTQQHANAVVNMHEGLLNAGVSKGQAAKRANEYAKRLKAQRCRNIARTETVRAATQGRNDFWRTLQSEGLVSTTALRRWIKSGLETTCNVCNALDGQFAGVDGQFTTAAHGSFTGPPAHPSCRCVDVLDFSAVQVAKANPYHDARGRFARASGGRAAAVKEHDAGSAREAPWTAQSKKPITASHCDALVKKYGNAAQMKKKLREAFPNATVTMSDNIKGCDPKEVARINAVVTDSLLRCAKKFPQVAASLDAISSRCEIGGADGEYWFTEWGGRGQCGIGMDTPHMARNKDYAAAKFGAIHEFGHALDNVALTNYRSKLKSSKEVIDTDFERLGMSRRNPAATRALEKVRNRAVLKPSIYAMTNELEFAAESFSAHFIGRTDLESPASRSTAKWMIDNLPPRTPSKRKLKKMFARGERIYLTDKFRGSGSIVDSYPMEEVSRDERINEIIAKGNPYHKPAGARGATGGEFDSKKNASRKGSKTVVVKPRNPKRQSVAAARKPAAKKPAAKKKQSAEDAVLNSSGQKYTAEQRDKNKLKDRSDGRVGNAGGGKTNLVRPDGVKITPTELGDTVQHMTLNNPKVRKANEKRFGKITLDTSTTKSNSSTFDAVSDKAMLEFKTLTEIRAINKKTGKRPVAKAGPKTYEVDAKRAMAAKKKKVPYVVMPVVRQHIGGKKHGQPTGEIVVVAFDLRKNSSKTWTTCEVISTMSLDWKLYDTTRAKLKDVKKRIDAIIQKAFGKKAIAEDATDPKPGDMIMRTLPSGEVQAMIVPEDGKIPA